LLSINLCLNYFVCVKSYFDETWYIGQGATKLQCDFEYDNYSDLPLSYTQLIEVDQPTPVILGEDPPQMHRLVLVFKFLP